MPSEPAGSISNYLVTSHILWDFRLLVTISISLSGGRGIRTHEALLPTGFQDQLHRPLGQPSDKDSRARGFGHQLAVWQALLPHRLR
jgi:hypothetical protein